MPTGAYYVSHANAYINHIASVFSITGCYADDECERAAKTAFLMEKAVCMSQMTPAQSQDASLTNNWLKRTQLPRGFDWDMYFRRLRVYPTMLNVDYVAFLKSCMRLMQSPNMVPYLRWRCADLLASQMGPRAEAAQFAFYGNQLAGMKKDRTLQKRRVNALETMLPEYIGLRFVELRKDEHRANRECAKLVAKSVAAALRASFVKSKRLNKATKDAWCEKLDRLRYKVGYPDDDDIAPAALEVAALAKRLAAKGYPWPTVVLETLRARRAMTLARFGHPINGVFWEDMQPHTVNACYVVCPQPMSIIVIV